MDQSTPPDISAEVTPRANGRPGTSWKRRCLRIVAGLVVALVIVVGPWPACDGQLAGPWVDSTEARLEQMTLTTTRGPALAGAAAVDITPQTGEPLAGFSGRNPMSCDGLADRVWAKAISISNGTQTVTIVGGDILLFLPDLRDAVLRRTGLPREQVYFTSTHTHSGPGGYAPGWLEQKMSIGRFDQACADRLADAFASAIAQSRAEMTPARIVVTRAAPSAPLVVNRIDADTPGNSTLACLSLVGVDGKHIAGLVTFNAHPTCYGRRNRLASGDYPGMVQRELARQYGGVWLFAAGATGSMKSATNQPRGAKRLVEVARKVLSVAEPLVSEAIKATRPAPSDQAAPSDNGASGKVLRSDSSTAYIGPCRSEATLAAAVLTVDLPQTDYRISRRWRLSPIMTSLIHDRVSTLHAVRINEMVLLGMPCDYSGELSARAERFEGVVASGRDELVPVVTSFNGDYIGYLIPRGRYDVDHYESRGANFFGPWCGEYFHNLSTRLVERLGESGVSGDR